MLSILTLVLFPAICSASSAAQVYLHPHWSSSAQPPAPHALLAHHLGLEAFESLPIEESGEVVLGGPQTFVGEGLGNALLVLVDPSRPGDVTPEALKPAFKIPTSSMSLSSVMERYTRLAHAVYPSISDPPARPATQPALRFLDILSLSASSSSKSDALERFMGSLAPLVAFVEEAHDGGAAEHFGAFEVTGLRDIEREWGPNSELYHTAAATLKATLQSVLSTRISLALLLPSHPTTALKVRQAQPPQSPLPQPSIPPTAPVFSTSVCHPTTDACVNASAACSSRGTCVGATRAGRTCFVCECGIAPAVEGGKNVTWAGTMCEKQDISQQFTLIVGTVIFLVLLVAGSITLLYSIGDLELPGTLMGGVGPIKRE